MNVMKIEGKQFCKMLQRINYIALLWQPCKFGLTNVCIADLQR